MDGSTGNGMVPRKNKRECDKMEPVPPSYKVTNLLI